MGPKDLGPGVIPSHPDDDDARPLPGAGVPDLELHTAPWSGLPIIAAGGPPPGAESGVHERAHPPTPSGRLRSIQPPDVARQTISELSVLGRELDILPDILAAAGLTREFAPQYRALLRDYLGLCHYAWDAVAEEQLEQAGSAADYRQAAVALARGVTRLKQEVDRVARADGGARPRRPPPLWRRRVQLVRQGLAGWRAELLPVPDPLRLGRALLRLRGDVGLARASALELALTEALVSAGLVLVAMLTLGAALLAAAGIAARDPRLTPTYALIAALGLGSWLAISALGAGGGLPLGALLGASVFAPGRAASLGAPGSRTATALLRGWWLLVVAVAAVGVPVALVAGGLRLPAAGTLHFPGGVADAAALVGGELYVALSPPAAFAAGALALLGLPFALAAQTRFVRELSGNVYWVPAARRYVLPASLTVVACLTAVLLALVGGASTALGWQRVRLVSAALGGFHGALTLRAVLLLGALALPYLLLLELPFRLGIARWRAQRLSDLAARRGDLDSQVRRLATQPASDEVLQAMQYDLVLLQFYRGQVQEAQAVTTAPYDLRGRLFALALAVVVAFALDGLGDLALRTLMRH